MYAFAERFTLDELGLRPALETLIERTQAAHGLAIDATLELDRDGPRLGPDIEIAVYRVIQESLNNAARHADGEHIQVIVLRRFDEVLVTVRDDGRGFDVDRPSTGFGLTGMRERIALVGGRLEISSGPTGTTIAAIVPIGGMNPSVEVMRKGHHDCARRRSSGGPVRAAVVARGRGRLQRGGRGWRRAHHRAPCRGLPPACADPRFEHAWGVESAGHPAPARSRAGHRDRSPDHAERSRLRPRGAAGRALGYVLKEAADGELVQAVRSAAEGRTYLNPELGARLAAEPLSSGGPPDDLSPRETEVLRMIALGHTNSEIASRLYLSVRTVESHRAHIQQKTGRTTRADLVAYAREHNML